MRILTRNVRLLATVAMCLGIVATEADADLTFIDWDVSQGGNGHLYAVTESPSSWFDAEAIAVAHGGHLVTINNQAEQDWLNATFPSGEPFHPWIGLWQDPNDPNYSEPGGGWVWVDGDPATYRNWAPGEPNQSLGASEGSMPFLVEIANGTMGSRHLFEAVFQVRLQRSAQAGQLLAAAHFA